MAAVYSLIRKELFKLITVFALISILGVTLVLIVPFVNVLNYRDLLFYGIIAFIIILQQLLLFILRRKRFKEEFDGLQDSLGIIVPTSAANRSSIPKEAVKIDENHVSYCISCGKSFTKKYSFCPHCGSCRISSFK